MEIGDASLTLFFTQGVGLKTWAEVGNIDRELELYKKLSVHLKQVSMVTYRGKTDLGYSKEVGDIKILPTTWHKKRAITILHLLMKYYSQIKDSSILKTNQIRGSEIPLWVKKRFKNKLIVRCGYLHSQFINKLTGNKVIRMNAYKLERDAFSFADIGVVSSSRDRDYVITRYKIAPEKITVVPNYVITDLFKPLPEIQKKYDLVFLGRSGKQKNLENLLKAINYLNKTEKRAVSLLMMGRCCFDRKIKETIERYKLNVTLNGNVPNFELPQIFNQAKIFILPSYFEGHPKALLEAMSCGIPCIGTDVTGIREDIEHLVTGYLCKTDFKSIADAIDTLMADESLQTKIGKNARNHILTNYSIDKILQMELDVIRAVLAS